MAERRQPAAIRIKDRAQFAQNQVNRLCWTFLAQVEYLEVAAVLPE